MYATCSGLLTGSWISRAKELRAPMVKLSYPAVTWVPGVRGLGQTSRRFPAFALSALWRTEDLLCNIFVKN
jgi:hypothetical protein